MLYMVTFTIFYHQYTPFMLAYIPYMDPMGIYIYLLLNMGKSPCLMGKPTINHHFQ